MSFDSTAEAPRFSLRDLPLAAKLVISCFLLAVGLGYTSALVQLHFQDSKSGKTMPTFDDVVLKFTGKKKLETPPPPPVSKFVKLLVTPPSAPFNGLGTMAPAFTTRDGAEFTKAILRGADVERTRLQPERDGERDALVLWAEMTDDAARKKAFEDDHFGLENVPAEKRPKAITPKHKTADGAIRVKTIITDRCTRCHKKDGDDGAAANYPLVNYDNIAKYLVVPETPPFKAGEYVKVEEPISLEKLTQSTHAHLLSFAVLFGLTGLVFAFSSYPMVVRCLIGLWALVAVVTDVAFWWLARLSDQYGVFFAHSVVFTGGAAGVGLGAQIVLSVWNMYGWKGKFMLVLVFAAGGAGIGLVAWKVVWPGLEEKQKQLEAQQANAKPINANANNGGGNVNDGNTGAKNDPVVGVRLSRMEEMLIFPILGPDGKERPLGQIPFKATEPGSMVRAFFDKDKDFAATQKEMDDAALKKLIPERHGEREALTAWVKLPDVERRKTYEADAFDLPKSLAGKPLTTDYLAGGKVKIKTLLADRCIRCHDGSVDGKYEFNEKYDSMLKYLELKPAAKP